MNRHNTISIEKIQEAFKEEKNKRFELGLQLGRCSEKVMTEEDMEKVEELSTKNYKVFYNKEIAPWEKEKSYHIINTYNNEYVRIEESKVLPKSVREALHNTQRNKIFQKKQEQ